MNKSDNSHSLEPLIINLPLDKDEYFPILDGQKAATMQSGLVTLKPGDDVGSHSTEDYEEFIIILEGSGEIETEGTGKRKIRSGQVAYNPPQTQHNVMNTGDSVLRYIYLVAKAIR